ncbi:hypothetical protein P0136_05695 [Lentisphaerota bacterium ZTH]|nr:hypothetical protein JYG24_03195 [Lentisphaerota bacterium]WET07484.1 hypothetical protein P0136_05695 [Lentisphaerota bacterium ZTH]
MKKNLLLLFMFLSCLIANQAWSQPRRMDDVWDVSSISRYEDDVQFAQQWSLEPYWNVSSPTNNHYPLIPEVPAIGQYTGEEYLFRQKVLIINMPPWMLDWAPRGLRQNILPNILYFHDISEMMDFYGYKCFVSAVITGKGSHPDDETLVGKEFNICYHGLLSTNHDPGMINFSGDIPVGMYSPRGILAASDETIPMERLANIHVSCHQDENDVNTFRCSPNNARFVPFTGISSFWTLAIIDDENKNIYVTYHLLCNTSNISDAVRSVVFGHSDFHEMLSVLKQVGESLNLDEFSKGVLRDWVDNINMLTSDPLIEGKEEFSDSDISPHEFKAEIKDYPKLVDEGHNGFNVIEYLGKFYAILQNEGAFDISKIDSHDYSIFFDGNSLSDVKGKIANYAFPQLVHENHHGFNIIMHQGRFYGILQSEGNFDINKIHNGGYSIFFEGESKVDVMTQVFQYQDS